MAKYRQVETQFWSDGFVLDLTPEEKYFYLYLMTNSKTTQCGIFELPKRIIETETGYNRDTVDKLLQRFTEYGKIQYCNETKEIMILNWIKYNQPNNTNAVKCVNKELKSIKDKRFINVFYLQCKKQELDVVSIFEGIKRMEQVEKIKKFHESKGSECSRESEDGKENKGSKGSEANKGVDKPLKGGLVGAYKGLPSNKVISNKEEVISNKQKVISNKQKIKNNKQEVISNSSSNKEKEQSDHEVKYEEAKYSEAKHSDCEETKDITTTAASKVEFKDIISVFENNIHPMVPMEYEKIIDWSSKFSSDLIIRAIEEAVSNSVRNMRYIEKILYTWLSNGITTSQGVEAYKREWEKQKNGKSKNSSMDQWNYSGQRSYDYDELEKKLLGLESEEDEEGGEEIGVNIT